MTKEKLRQLLNKIWQEEAPRFFTNVPNTPILTLTDMTDSRLSKFQYIKCLGFYDNYNHEIAILPKGYTKRILIHEIAHALGFRNHLKQFQATMRYLMKKHVSRGEYITYMNSKKRSKFLRDIKLKDSKIAFHSKKLEYYEML